MHQPSRIHYCQYDGPLGPLLLGGTGGALEFLHFPQDGVGRIADADWEEDRAAYAPVCAALDGYFAGRLKHFSLPYRLHGSPFQMAVWEELAKIPYGELRSYGDIARAVGDAGAARAVGMANHVNPLPIIIPCHRVIGADGSLVGFGGGMKIKTWLLEHEGIMPSQVYMPGQMGFGF